MAFATAAAAAAAIAMFPRALYGAALCFVLCVPTAAQQTQNEEPHNAVGFRSSDLQIAMQMKKAGRLPEASCCTLGNVL